MKNEASKTKNTLRWRLTGRPGAWTWHLVEGEAELGHIKLGPRGTGWYIVSTGKWGILIHMGRKFDKLSEAATKLRAYWVAETYRPAKTQAEVA